MRAVGPQLKFLFVVGAALSALLAGQSAGAKTAHGGVNLVKTPNDGLQPQAVVDRRGVLHLVYFAGEPSAGDIYYVRRAAGRADFSAPLRVNSQPGSAIATGTIRGAHLAVGGNGRAHVAWMGSRVAEPRGPGGEAPMLYARLNDAGTAFEAQRNVMQFSGGLDGGGSVAADEAGGVYVAWHGRGDAKGEASRRVWLARSADGGQTFARETPAWGEPTGACGCCGMRAFVDREGALHLLYRAATEEVNRDMYWLTSQDSGRSFRGLRLAPWRLNVCPMSTAALAAGRRGALLAWETEGQVYFTAADAAAVRASAPVAAPGAGGRRKHPVVAAGPGGEKILVWTEGTGWKKGGSLAWQVYDRDNNPVGGRGEAAGVPVWGLAAVVAEKGGGFTVIY